MVSRSLQWRQMQTVYVRWLQEKNKTISIRTKNVTESVLNGIHHTAMECRKNVPDRNEHDSRAFIAFLRLS